MKFAILTTQVFHDCKEVTHIVDNKKVLGTDKIIYGGAERYLFDLCQLLQDDGHSVVVYQPFPGINKPFAKRYKDIDFFMIPNNGGWLYNTCQDLNWQFNEYAALSDIRIYFGTFLAYPNVISPCIAISHGIYWDNTQGNNTTQILDEAQRKEFFRRQMYGFTAPDVVVSVDSNVRKVIQAMEPGSERKIQIIYNYCDTQKFYPTEKKTWDGVNVLFPRRLTVLRGSTEVTKAFINLPQYNFTLAGQAHDDAAAQAFFKAHEHRGNVKFIHREMDEMPEVYRRADISLVPTISTEGTSLSMIESMATGLPIITTPVGGLGDLCIPGYNALVYDPNHEDICDYITALAEIEEMRTKFGKRNREIACECFDISIWKQKWRDLLAQFGAVPERQYPGVTIVDEYTPMTEKQWDYLKKGCAELGKAAGDALRKVLPKISENAPETVQAAEDKMIAEAQKPKLVAMMLTHNEAGRYLERVIENTLLFCDQIVILDDHSTDYDKNHMMHFANAIKWNDRLTLYNAVNSWGNESLLRKELLDCALKHSPNWLIAIDSDELYEADRMNEQLPYLMSQTDADWVGFRFFDMWDDEQHYRDDDIWPAGMIYAPRMFKVKSEMKYEWPDVKRHCGSIPVNVLQADGINSSIRVKHLGWMKQDDRKIKVAERIKEDPHNQYFTRQVYESALETNLTLVEWDDNNPWQTGKLTIAYPPGMEWNVMQQRPHHLLKLAAGERNRVFFGDDTAPGAYEPLSYLTVVKDWESVKEVDVLYITNPAQMSYCGKLSAKKLIYDCCDWQHYADEWLINNADIILCASKKLYDIVVAIRRYEKNVVYLPNACDFEHFSKTSAPAPEIPEPVIGYMGCVHPAMIDEGIVKALAQKYKLLMIGQNKGMTFDSPKIYTTGHVPYARLPGILSTCSVGIIPFRTDSDYIKYSAPIKAIEYLAAGRPVVASPIPELEPLADMGLIRIVDNDDLDGWIKAIELAIQEYPNTRGIEYAKQNTWETRWAELKKLI